LSEGKGYDQIKEDEMGGACVMHGRDEKCTHSFDMGTWRKVTTWNT